MRNMNMIAEINPEKCVACGDCQMVCPAAAINMLKGCFASANAEFCIGCEKCLEVCPKQCIEMVVYRY